ncbi:hypothetical protein [Polyangium mundeleinium]|uniref:Uncharacterized protein n=1 Tax=Polyangium mundeleinium TaxID=2995306 RepID=A0ABT5EPM0_9BACT|nr:hypothetical protein [Polyangium mundeleinium]MDC0743779.1 hypothetical protein [Polyangium mundeleinium]
MDTNRAFVAGAVLVAWGALAACHGSDRIEQRTGPGGASEEITTSTGGSVGAATVGPGGAGEMGGAGGETSGTGAGGSIGEGGSGSAGGGGSGSAGGSGGVAAGGGGGAGGIDPTGGGGFGSASAGCSADLDCNDFIDCTHDKCVAGECNHGPDSAKCADEKICNGVETCDPQLGCTSGAPVNCDDGIPCTYDLCHDPTGTCVHYPQDNLCDDGTFCDGVEVCDPLQGCIEGTPVTCNDGIPCTNDVCDELLDTCKGIPDPSLCPCNQTCDPSQGGCGDFCKVATCQGEVYACGDCVDNDGDCKTDTADEQCLDPCDDTEQ